MPLSSALPRYGEVRHLCYEFPLRGNPGFHLVKINSVGPECLRTASSTAFWLCWNACVVSESWALTLLLTCSWPRGVVCGLTLVGLGSVHQVGPIQVCSSIGQGHQAGVGHGRPAGLLDVGEGAVRGWELSCRNGWGIRGFRPTGDPLKVLPILCDQSR